jgi:hypothetical protein
LIVAVAAVVAVGAWIRLAPSEPSASGAAPASSRPTGDHDAGAGRRNNTAAFQAAIDAASRRAHGYPHGPTGAPQGVVKIPAGRYRILNVKMRSNVRLEISAGAMLMQAGGPRVRPARLFILDGSASVPLRNVTIIGVGTSPTYGGLLKPTPAPGWNIKRDFAMNLDPVGTNSSPYVRGIDVRNVDGFLISRMFVRQNNSRRSGRPPDSQRAAIGLSSDSFSPVGGPYFEPRNGVVRHVYGTHEPAGYGPDQVDAAEHVQITNVYSGGGTALRLETQASHGKYGSIIDGLSAAAIMCRHGNQAVSFSPHAQDNQNVTVTGVTAVDCNQGVKVSGYLEPGLSHHGVFLNSRVQGVLVHGGPGAQLTKVGSWVLGLSDRAIAVDPNAPYTIQFSGITCTGSFQRPSDVPC